MPEPTQVTLTVVDGPCKGLMASFDSFSVIIGRAEDADFRLTEDLRVSRRHASIATGGHGEVLVSDCGSRFGTYLADRRIDEEEIRPGETIRIGECAIRVDWTPTSAGGPPVQNAVPEGHTSRRVWVYAAFAVGALAVAFAVWRKPAVEPPAPAAVVDRLSAAREARNGGDLEAAIELLQSLLHDADSDARYDAVLELLAECKRLKRRFDVANAYEKHLRLEGALDEWRIILLKQDFLDKSDPLRGWVQSQQIERIETRLMDLRKNSEPDS
jgi:hypothetical protein